MPRGKPNKLTKSDFVRGLGKIPAKEVVALAAQKGMTLTERYVYVIRSADKRKGDHVRARPGGRARAGSSDAALRQAIAELGLSRAREIIAEVEAAFAR